MNKELGFEPCEIEWESGQTCKNVTNVELIYLHWDFKYNFSYTPPSNAIAYLSFEPSYIVFLNKEINKTYDTIIKVKAINADFEEVTIISSNPQIKVEPNKFSIKKNNSIEIKFVYHVIDSSDQQNWLLFQNDICPTSFYISSRYSKNITKTENLKVVHPNGGEIFLSGNDTIIYWNSTLYDKFFKVKFSPDSGKTFFRIDSVRNFKTNWLIPNNIQSNKCLVKINVKGFKINVDKILKVPIQSTDICCNIKFSINGSKFALFSNEKVQIFNYQSLEKQIDIEDISRISDVMFVKNDEFLAIVKEKDSILIFDLVNKQFFDTLLIPIRKIFIDETGVKLALVFGKRVTVYDLVDKKIITTILNAHSGDITAVDVKTSKNILVTGSSDGTVKTWVLSTGILLNNVIQNEGIINELRLTNETTTLIIQSSKGIKFVNYKTGEIYKSFGIDGF